MFGVKQHRCVVVEGKVFGDIFSFVIQPFPPLNSSIIKFVVTRMIRILELLGLGTGVTVHGRTPNPDTQTKSKPRRHKQIGIFTCMDSYQGSTDGGVRGVEKTFQIEPA